MPDVTATYDVVPPEPTQGSEYVLTETGYELEIVSAGLELHDFTQSITATSSALDEFTAPIPGSAVDYGITLTETAKNTNPGDLKGVALRSDVAMSVKFRDSGGTVLATVTLAAGEMKTWVYGETPPSWMFLETGDIDNLQVTRLSSGTDAEDLVVSLFFEGGVIGAPPNTLLTGLENYFNMESSDPFFYEVLDSTGGLATFYDDGYGFLYAATGIRGAGGVDVGSDTDAYLSGDGGGFGSPLRSPLTDSDTSYSFWVKLNATGEIVDIGGHYSDFNSFSNRGHIKIDHNGSGFEASIEWMNGAGDGAQTWTVALPTLVANGSWYNIVITRDNADTLRFYVNTVLDGSVTITSSAHSNAGFELIIGRGPVGIIDEFGIWSRVLSDVADGDIEDLYNSGSGLLYPDLTI